MNKVEWALGIGSWLGCWELSCALLLFGRCALLDLGSEKR